MRMLLEHRRHSTVLHLSGEFDGMVCRGFLKQVENLYREDEVNLILEMEEVTSINSTGIGACIRAAKAVRRKGGEVVFAGLSDDCRKPIEALGVDTIIPLFEDEAAAARHFSQGEEAPDIDHPEGFADGRLTVLFHVVDPDLNDDLMEAERNSGVRRSGRPRRGKTWHAVGHMADMQTDSIRFDWDCTHEGLDADSAREYFEVGTQLSLAFTMSFLDKKRHHCTVEITEITSLDDVLTFVADYVDLDEETSKAIHRYVADIVYLRQEVKKANEAEAGGG